MMTFMRRASAALLLACASLFPMIGETQEVTVRKAVQYAVHDGVALNFDVYSPRSTGRHPAVIGLHGGAWKIGDAATYARWGQWLAQRGYVLVSVDYRLVKGRQNLYPAAVHDVRAAIQAVRARADEFGVDPARIALMGDSAGAHLAALVALTADSPLWTSAYPGDPHAQVSAKVKAVVAAYGVYDMVAQWQHDQIHRPRDNITEGFLGVSPAQDRRRFHEASPLTYTTIDNASTSFLLTWGTADDIVDPVSQSEAFLIALKQAGFYVRTVVHQAAPHFWIWDPVDEVGSHNGFLAPRLLRFLSDRL